ncbi:unnamed protein product [Closterium sp. Yama58-4]|nr:unnamed protein product [Closterium sp. Yama58-4]
MAFIRARCVLLFACLAAALVATAYAAKKAGSLSQVLIAATLTGDNEVPKDGSPAGVTVGDQSGGVADMTLTIYK